MDGVFMKKILSFLLVLTLIFGGMFAYRLISDQRQLENALVRLHVVAASDSAHDQRVKLCVRDAVLESLDGAMDTITDVSAARQYIQTHLLEIQEVANRTLDRLGETKRAVVGFMKEEFPMREYDDFSLPSGVYDALRIVIGEGEGHNWWCVVFPRMCYGAAEVKSVTAGAGFSEQLQDTITGEYQVRFFLMDAWGRVKNFFRRG